MPSSTPGPRYAHQHTKTLDNIARGAHCMLPASPNHVRLINRTNLTGRQGSLKPHTAVTIPHKPAKSNQPQHAAPPNQIASTAGQPTTHPLPSHLLYGRPALLAGNPEKATRQPESESHVSPPAKPNVTQATCPLNPHVHKGDHRGPGVCHKGWQAHQQRQGKGGGAATRLVAAGAAEPTERYKHSTTTAVQPGHTS